jgi:hypothetical protein
MKNNKRLMFMSAGILGGCLGAFLSEIYSIIPDGNLFLTIAKTAIWMGICAAIITAALFGAGEMYYRRPFKAKIFLQGLIVGAIAGAIAGGVAQIIFWWYANESLMSQVLLRSFCWGLAGAILGWRLAAVVPNLGLMRGLISGFIGGFVGGIVFLICSLIFPETFGRVVGIGILGGALGLAVIAVEEFFRSARLEIIWAPKEITSVTLGPKPVYIGGGDDHVFVAGLPEHAIGIVLENGRIECMQAGSDKRTLLKDGSRIKVGRVEIVVKTTPPSSTT